MMVWKVFKETSHPGPLALQREAWWDLLKIRPGVLHCSYGKCAGNS